MGIRLALIAVAATAIAAQGPTAPAETANAPATIATVTITPSITGKTAACSWARIEAPATRAGRHLQLEAPGAERVWLNGVLLQAAGEPGGYDIAWSVRRRNVVVRRPPGPLEVRITPRVFVGRIETQANPRRMRVWITNTLENTSNVFVSLRTGDAAVAKTLVEVSATVPPGVTQMVDLAVPEFQLGEPLWAVLDKEEEAMEGAYRHQVGVPGPIPW